nr:ORF-239; putative [Ipomoea batatas]
MEGKETTAEVGATSEDFQRLPGELQNPGESDVYLRAGRPAEQPDFCRRRGCRRKGRWRAAATKRGSRRESQWMATVTKRAVDSEASRERTDRGRAATKRCYG